MKLPRIPSMEPVTIEPPEPAEFGDLCISSLVMRPTIGDGGSLSVTLLPYDYDSDVALMSKSPVRIEIKDLSTFCNERLVFSKALQDFAMAIGDAAAEKQLVRKYADTRDKNLLPRLTQVQVDLGRGGLVIDE